MPEPLRTLVLSPEPPYPLHGGGAFRIASLLHYLARISAVDLVLISDSGLPALLPPELAIGQRVVQLAPNRRDPLARYLRNARRAVLGIPPLIDRLSGLDSQLERLLGGQHWDLGIIEHSWCAQYVEVLRRHCNRVVLDLHNVESVLHQSCAPLSRGLVRLGHQRFAVVSRRTEARVFPEFSMILTTSDSDAMRVRELAPQVPVCVYPNAYPNRVSTFPAPVRARRTGEMSEKTGGNTIAFSGNFEYHPNIDAMDYLARELWPIVRRQHPDLRLRLVGRGDQFIRHLLQPGMETTGPVEDAFDEIARADLVIAPLRIGSGTRLKIIEAWAAGRPVIATPLAAEGLKAVDGQNIVLASDAAGLAGAITALLRDPARCERLGTAGRATFEVSYSWNAAWRALDLDAQLLNTLGLNGYTG